MASIFIGLAAGFVCFLAINLKSKFGYDDFDVVGVHGVGGTLGPLRPDSCFEGHQPRGQ
jgi:Amt family ammonium transporter